MGAKSNVNRGLMFELLGPVLYGMMFDNVTSILNINHKNQFHLLLLL